MELNKLLIKYLEIKENKKVAIRKQNFLKSHLLSEEERKISLDIYKAIILEKYPVVTPDTIYNVINNYLRKKYGLNLHEDNFKSLKRQIILDGLGI